MSVRAKWLWALLGLICIGVSVFMVRTFSAAGQFTRLPTHGTQTCSTLNNMPGAEDLVIDRKRGVAFISSQNRRTSPVARGEIYALDLTAKISEMKYQPLTLQGPAQFSPLGLSLFTNEAGEKRLFVINRAKGQVPRVEIFKLNGEKLDHLKTVTSSGFATANNLVAVGDEQFYLTNDGASGDSFVQRFFDFANQKQKGNVVYFNGTESVEVASGFVMPNGIAKSIDGKVIYVSDTHARILNFYARSEDNSLSKIGDLFVGTGLDNIDVDAEGHLWLGAHPKLLDLYYHEQSAKKISPSQIIEAVPGKGVGGQMRTVFLDDGKRISGSSIGARYKDRVIIGGAYENKMLLCDIPKWEKKQEK